MAPGCRHWGLRPGGPIRTQGAAGGHREEAGPPSCDTHLPFTKHSPSLTGDTVDSHPFQKHVWSAYCVPSLFLVPGIRQGTTPAVPVCLTIFQPWFLLFWIPEARASGALPLGPYPRVSSFLWPANAPFLCKPTSPASVPPTGLRGLAFHSRRQYSSALVTRATRQAPGDQHHCTQSSQIIPTSQSSACSATYPASPISSLANLNKDSF